MENLSKILNLMNRMRLFPEVDSYKLREKFIVENIHKDLLEESIHLSYRANEMIKILCKYYNIGFEDNFLENGNDIGIYYEETFNSEGLSRDNEIVTIILIIPNNFSDIKKIEQFFVTCGWTLAQTKEYYKNNNYTIYAFQKNRQINEVELPDILYHLTPETKLQKILKNGLVPRTSNVMSNRPERVYFYPEKMSLLSLQRFSNDLWKKKLEQKLNLNGLSKEEIGEKLNQPRTEKYCLLQIDTTKCDNLKIYGDPDMDGAVWTYDNIPPQAITLLKKDI